MSPRLAVNVLLAHIQTWVFGVLVILLIGCSTPSAEEHLAKAKEYTAAGQDDAAIIELKNALKQSFDLFEARAMLADLEFSSGNYVAAQAHYERALESFGAPDERDEGYHSIYDSLLLCRIRTRNAAVVISELSDLDGSSDTNGGSDSKAQLSARKLALLGFARLALDDSEMAEQEFVRAVEADAAEALAYYGIARIAAQNGQSDRAKDAYQKTVALDPRDLEVFLSKGEFEVSEGDFDAARKTYELALALPGNDYRARLGNIKLMMFEKNFEAAHGELNAILDVSPNLLSARYIKALVFYEQDDLTASSIELRRVLIGQPDYPPALYLLGTVQFKQEDYLQAEVNLSYYLTLNPKDVSARKLLGAVLIQLGNHEGVVAALQGLAERSNDAQVLAMLGTAYARLNKQVEAAELLERAVELSPNISALRNQLAVTLLAEGANEQAIVQLRTATEINSELQLSNYLLVLAELREGNLDEALAAANQIRERAPDNPMGENLLGAIRFAQGDTDGARSAFEASLAINSAFKPAALNLVRLELADGNRDVARDGLEALLEVDANSARALLKLAEMELEDAQLRPSQRVENFARAEELISRAAKAHPTSLEPQLALAQLGLRNRDPQLADSASLLAAQLAPDNPSVLVVRIESLLLAGKRSGLSRPLQRLTLLAERQVSDNPTLMLTLARLHERSGEAATARRILNKIDGEALSSSDSTDVSSDEDEPSLRSAVNLELLRFDLADGELVKARTRLEKASDASRSSELYQILRADLLYAEDSRAAAQESYTKLLAADSRVALFRLVALHNDAGEPATAVPLLKQWIEKYPEDRGAQVALATSTLSSGEYVDAQRRFEKALEQTPDNVVVLNNLAWLYQQTGDSRSQEIAERAWALAPDNADVADTYGWILASAGQTERGSDILLRAYAIAPENPSIAFHAASTLAEAGRVDRALEILQDIGESSLADSSDADAALALLRRLIAVNEIEAEAK